MKPALFLAVVLLLAVSAQAASAYDLQITSSKIDAAQRGNVSAWIAAYNSTVPIQNITRIVVYRSMENYAGWFYPGGSREDTIIKLNAYRLSKRWQYEEVLTHELAHQVCWQKKRDLMHGACFESAYGNLTAEYLRNYVGGVAA